jgi:hypothetical protein
LEEPLMITKNLLTGTFHSPLTSDKTTAKTQYVTILRTEYDRLLEENSALKQMLELTRQTASCSPLNH